MMCYKDMTFCVEDTCALKDKCPRFFTEKDRQDAIKWWGNENFPLATFVGTPTCFKETE